MTNVRRPFYLFSTKYLGSCKERLGNRMHSNGAEDNSVGQDLTTKIYFNKPIREQIQEELIMNMIPAL